MNIGEFASLEREAQFAEAGRIAGVEPSVFDGLWRTESGRGANMLGPVTRNGKRAEGHFQLMPDTRTTMEGRFGSPINPHDFGQSLYTAAHLLKENLGRFKNLPDALRAYNGGWDKSRWGNPETAAYAGKVLGTDLDEATDTNASTAQAADGIGATVSRQSAAQLSGQPFPGRTQKPVAPLSAVSKATASLMQMGTSPVADAAPLPTSRFTADAQRVADADLKAKREAEETSFTDTARAAAYGTVPVALLQALFRDPEPVDPAFVVPEEAMKGRSLEDQREIATASSKKQLDRILFDIDYAKEQDRITFQNGTAFGLGAMFLAAAPEAMMSGGIASLAFGRQAAAVAATGSRAGALAVSTVEGVVGNVINTAALDMLGRRQGVNGYVIGAAGGLLNPLMQGAYLGRIADRAIETQTATRLMQEATEKEAKLLTEAQSRLGTNASPEDLRAEMDRVEAEGIRADVASHRAAVPESRKLVVGEVDEVAVAPEIQQKIEAEDKPVDQTGELDTRAQTPRWESPSFQADREAKLQSDPEWQARLRHVSDGIAGSAPRVAFDEDGQAALPLRKFGLKATFDLQPQSTHEDIVAFVNGKEVGRVSYAPGDKEQLTDIKVAPQFQHMGIGTHLLDLAESRGAKFPPSSKDVGGTRTPAAIALHRSREARQPGPFNLDAITGIKATDAVMADPSLKKQAGVIMELADKYGLKNVLITNKVVGAESGVVMSFGDKHIIGLAPGQLPTAGQHTALHELGHAIYHQHAPTAPPELMARIHADWEEFVKGAKKGDPTAWENRWAFTSPNRTAKSLSNYSLSRDEYMAEQYVKHLQNAAIAGHLGGRVTPGVIKQITDAVAALWNYVADLVRGGHLKSAKAADEFFMASLEGGFAKVKAGEQFLDDSLRLPSVGELGSLSQTIPPALAKEVDDFMNDPVARAHGLDRMPMGTPAERAEAKQVLALYKKALSPEYAVDEKRLSKLLSKVDALNPTSNLMLRSKNPVVRMAALELLENGAGAGGRRSTASIAKYMNERAIVGDAIVRMDQEFKVWFKGQPDASGIKEAFSGKKRAEFSRLVAEEIEQRRYPGAQTDMGQSVRNAADAMEASFERARLMQVDARTAGWAALPESSKGYMPHRMKSQTYRNLSVGQKRALHGELTDQFVTVSGFDMSFADQLASKYLDRVENRALGGFDAPMGLHQVGAADVIREALEQMQLSRPEIDAMMKRHVAGAAAHTKKRLNLDLRRVIQVEDGTSFRLLDLYDTDMLSLMRGQSQRVSGEVALARHGVMGKPGLAILRRAMGYGGNNEQAVLKEIKAFDQVAAEFLGQPFGEANKWVDRAMQFNSVSSLGGMGFNQLGELINLGATLGVKSALSYVPEFSRVRAEVLKLGKGQKVDNAMLSSLETMGGAEFGTDAYKMVFPMDNPDLFNNSMGPDSLTGGDRLLRGAGHLQSKLSLWRTLHSTQTRFVAEQIVLKAAKAIKNGDNDFHLRDMGMDDDMLKRLRADAHHIVNMKEGKVTRFDITKAKDQEAAHAFIQAVHRGASQIIQGTFIGETGAYVHNSWLRLLTQFRSFSLTAIDKQWNRQVGNRGIGGAVLVTLAAMSAAAPLYMARTYAASLGRKDQEEYLEKHMSFGAIARATTNYIATAGLAGDFMDAATAVTGTGEFTGGRSGSATTAIGNLVAPAAGKVDKLWGAVQNTRDGTDPHALIKELPLSRLPFFIPAVNALGN